MKLQHNNHLKNQAPAIIICLIFFVVPTFFLHHPSVTVDALYWSISLALTGIALCIFAPQSAHSYLLFSVLSILIIGVGFYEFASVLLWLISVWSLGSLFLNTIHIKRESSFFKITEASLIGAAIWLAIWGGMMHFPLNHQIIHTVLCLFPCIFLWKRSSSIRNELSAKAHTAKEWMHSIPLWAWVTGLAIIGWVLRWTSFPSMGYDDHTLHLRVWSKLSTQHYYDFDVNTQIWSLAPFIVDLLHAGLSLMAGNDARGAMNLSLAILILLLMRKILYLWKLPAWSQWLLMILMASTPMLGNLLLSLQTELALAVLTIAGIRLVIDSNENLSGQHVLAMLACAALCAGIKLPGAVLGLTLLIALAFRLWNQRRISKSRLNDGLRFWPALALLLPLSFVALHSYLLAWIITKNPVFPLYNAIFLSPYYHPVNFSDPRWIHGFNFASYFRAFFHTSEFFESGNFTAGWQYLFLFPLAIIAILHPTRPNNFRITLIPLLGFGLLMFSATQYWRYLFPIMPIAGILFATLFVSTSRSFKILSIALITTCIALNLIFFTRISWMMRSPASTAIQNSSKEDLIRVYAPIVLLTELINRYAPNSRVLYPYESPYGATLNGSPLYINWYSPLRLSQFSSLKTEQDLKDFLSKENPDFVITDMNDKNSSHQSASLLREHLAKFGSAIARENSFILYRLSDLPIIYYKEFELSKRKIAGELDLLPILSKNGLQASLETRPLASLQTHRAKQARYNVKFDCPSEKGSFVAQINWDKGEVYYRLISCSPEKTSFSEAIPIPVGAMTGTIYITARDTESINIEDLSVELH